MLRTGKLLQYRALPIRLKRKGQKIGRNNVPWRFRYAIMTLVVLYLNFLLIQDKIEYFKNPQKGILSAWLPKKTFYAYKRYMYTDR